MYRLEYMTDVKREIIAPYVFKPDHRLEGSEGVMDNGNCMTIMK